MPTNSDLMKYIKNSFLQVIVENLNGAEQAPDVVLDIMQINRLNYVFSNENQIWQEKTEQDIRYLIFTELLAMQVVTLEQLEHFNQVVDRLLIQPTWTISDSPVPINPYVETMDDQQRALEAKTQLKAYLAHHAGFVQPNLINNTVAVSELQSSHKDEFLHLIETANNKDIGAIDQDFIRGTTSKLVFKGIDAGQKDLTAVMQEFFAGHEELKQLFIRRYSQDLFGVIAHYLMPLNNPPVYGFNPQDQIVFEIVAGELLAEVVHRNIRIVDPAYQIARKQYSQFQVIPGDITLRFKLVVTPITVEATTVNFLSNSILEEVALLIGLIKNKDETDTDFIVRVKNYFIQDPSKKVVYDLQGFQLQHITTSTVAAHKNLVTKGTTRLSVYPELIAEIDRHPDRKAIMHAIGVHPLPINEAVIAEVLENFPVPIWQATVPHIEEVNYDTTFRDYHSKIQDYGIRRCMREFARGGQWQGNTFITLLKLNGKPLILKFTAAEAATLKALSPNDASIAITGIAAGNSYDGRSAAEFGKIQTKCVQQVKAFLVSCLPTAAEELLIRFITYCGQEIGFSTFYTLHLNTHGCAIKEITDRAIQASVIDSEDGSAIAFNADFNFLKSEIVVDQNDEPKLYTSCSLSVAGQVAATLKSDAITFIGYAPNAAKHLPHAYQASQPVLPTFSAIPAFLGKTRAIKLIAICQKVGLQNLAAQMGSVFPQLTRILQHQTLPEIAIERELARLIKTLASINNTTEINSLFQNFLKYLVDDSIAVARCVLADAAAIMQEAKYLVWRDERIQKMHAINQQPLSSQYEQVAAPLFWRWLKTQSTTVFYEQAKKHTAQWTCDDWHRHIPTFFAQHDADIFLKQLQKAHSQFGFLTTAPTLLPEEFSLLRGEARLIQWLETSPQLVELLKNTHLKPKLPIFWNETLWEALARIVGESPDKDIAKDQLDTWLKQYREKAPITAEILVSGILDQRELLEPASLEIETLRRLQIELCLAKFEELNPAFIRWFRINSTRWHKIIDAFKDLTVVEIEKLLLNISYILMHGDKNNLALCRLLFKEPLNQIASTLQVGDTYADFNLGSITFEQPLLTEMSDEALALALSDSDLQLMINSSRAAVGLHVLANTVSSQDVRIQAEELLVNARQIETNVVSPVLHTLRLQETRDVALMRKVQTLVSESLDTMQSLQPTDSTKLTLTMHIKTAAVASREYVAKNMKVLREHLATAQLIAQQITDLDDSVKHTLKQTLVYEEKTQQTLIRQTARYEEYIAQLDKVVLQCDDVLKQAVPRLLAKQKYKAALYTKPEETIIVEPKNKPVMEMVQTARDTLLQGASLIINPDAAAVVQELKQDDRYVQATKILGSEQALIMSVETEETVSGQQAFVSTIHEMPAMPKVLDTLFCWFKGVKTPFAMALENWIDKQFELAMQSSLNTVFIDCSEVKVLEAALCIAHVKNFIRQYNGEPEILINYSDRWKLNVASIVEEAYSKAKALINKHDSVITQQEKAERIAREDAQQNMFHSNNRIAG